MSSAWSILRTAWFSLLVLLLGLMPFIHGHLGQPVQGGWHIHTLSVAAEIQTSPEFNGLSCLASHHTATAAGASGLHKAEPSTVELASRIAQSRSPEISLAACFGAFAPVLFVLSGPVLPALAVPSTGWPPTSNAVIPRLRHELPPPVLAPPSSWV